MTRTPRQARQDDRAVAELRIPALEVRQGPNRTLYTFAIDGKQLPEVAAVARVRRDEDTCLRGYQRPAVLTHIKAIRRYIESADPLLPNALVVAFDKRVTFESSEQFSPSACSRPGTLVIPCERDWADADKPGWIVDGQQRSAAIREAEVAHFPVCVTAFITDDEADQRSQFILVNNTRPLPKGLIHELLPTASGALPAPLQVRRLPARLLERLNYDVDSPMRHRIQSPTMPEGVIKDNSVLRMLENSLLDGALYQYRHPHTGGGKTEAMLAVVKTFWKAVSIVFDEAWKLPPRKSRLTHGIGVISLGYVMDAIADTMPDVDDVLNVENVINELAILKDVCPWTAGTWEFSDGTQRKWNDVQNTSRDIRMVTNHLLSVYRAGPDGHTVRQLRLI
ncbi:MAG: DGQHR domain-containing protein DpdB [Pseudonocardiaceae bacterium]